VPTLLGILDRYQGVVNSIDPVSNTQADSYSVVRARTFVLGLFLLLVDVDLTTASQVGP